MAEEYELVLGLETHVQLKTREKLFCACPTLFAAPPNSQVCPVCLALPGALPTINREAVDLAIRAALALDCQIQLESKFDRKNYFYPDLPKNYQISQYDMPLARNGRLEIATAGGTKPVRIQRLHLEEDAGKLLHEEGGPRSFVDLNRAGIPLIEIVTEPDLRSPEEAQAYLIALRDLLRYVGVTNADMEKGEFRCDVNVSVRPPGAAFGTRCEIKNLNSFRFAADAIRFEYERQADLLRRGSKVVQETRFYDPDTKQTRPMRTKEGVTDYRYFPEPDLPPLRFSAEEIEALRASLPERPAARRARFQSQYGLSPYDSQVLTAERALADYFEETVRLLGNAKTAANWIINEVNRLVNEFKLDSASIPLPPSELVALIRLVESKKITNLSAKEVLETIVREGGRAEDVIRRRGLEQLSDPSSLEKVVEEAIAKNPRAVQDYRNGKETAQKFLLGQVMKLTGGRANARLASELLARKLR